ncbi:hypothetical protein [Aquabacterium fontiphilum]|uniref:hypothetical protein n=1 Tax=Aquabacterium fontiphilum TaxID=450365 RepID=UPI00191BE019
MSVAEAGGPLLGAPARATEALGRVLPMIEQAVTDPAVSGMGYLAIVVLTPMPASERARFEDAVVLEHAIGDRTAWDVDYLAFARAKARLCWEHGCDGRTLLQTMPHRVRSGDSLLIGAVHLDGLVVAVSGAHPWYDEAFAWALATMIRALAHRDLDALAQAGAHTAPQAQTGPLQRSP